MALASNCRDLCGDLARLCRPMIWWVLANVERHAGLVGTGTDHPRAVWASLNAAWSAFRAFCELTPHARPARSCLSHDAPRTKAENSAQQTKYAPNNKNKTKNGQICHCFWLQRGGGHMSSFLLLFHAAAKNSGLWARGVGRKVAQGAGRRPRSELVALGTFLRTQKRDHAHRKALGALTKKM